MFLDILYPFELQGSVVVKGKENFSRSIEFVHPIAICQLTKRMSVKRNILLLLL